MAKYIVAFDSTAFSTPSNAVVAIANSGATVVTQYTIPYTYEIEATAEQLSSLEHVLHSEPSDVAIGAELQVITDFQWKYLSNSLSAQWGETTFRPKFKGAGVTVYIVDTGVQYSHSEFLSADVNYLYSINEDGAADFSGHGTAVASLIVGQNIGVAKEATLQVVKIFNEDAGVTTLSDILGGLDAVYAHHMANGSSNTKVVCLPWTINQSNLVDAKIRELNNNNLVVVAAAGNQSTDVANYTPARVQEIITVGSVDAVGNISAFTNLPFGNSSTGMTNYGAEVDIFTIGVNVDYASNSPDEVIMQGQGTSLSAGIVAGGAASYINKHPSFTSSQIKSTMISEGSVAGKSKIRVAEGVTGVDLNELNLSLLVLDGEDSSELTNYPSGRLLNVQLGATDSLNLGFNAGSTDREVLSFSPLPPFVTLDLATGDLSVDTSSLDASMAPGVYLFAIRGKIGTVVSVEEYGIGVYASDVSELADATNYYYDTDTSTYDAVESTTYYQGAVPQKN